MMKGILILDKPDTCEMCRFKHTEGICGHDIRKCPIRIAPVPQYYPDDEFKDDWQEGWNAAVHEIIKDKTRKYDL